MLRCIMELNIEKIEEEMVRTETTKADLARFWGITRQAVDYYWTNRPIKMAERFGLFFKISPKDFIK